MADSVVIKIDTTVLDRIVAKTGAIREDAVREAAEKVEAKAKVQVAALDAIDTGTLVNSIYTTYGKVPKREDSAYSRRQQRTIDISNREINVLPDPKKGRHEDVAYVGPSVKYGIYVEFGTTKMAARPYMANSVNGIMKDMIKELRRLQNGK